MFQITQFAQEETVFKLIPNSGKIVVFDSKLFVKV